MVRAASKGIRLQTLTLGAVLGGFGLVSIWAIPRLLRPEWMAVTLIYPFVAVGYPAHAIGQFEGVMLSVVNLNRWVAEFYALYVFLFVGSALPLVPRLGAVEDGWGELVVLAS